MNSRDHTTKNCLTPIAIVLLCLLYGCTSFTKKNDIYSSEIVPISNGGYYITVKARIEKNGIENSMEIAHKACKEDNKPRILLLEQTSLYTAAQHSKFETPYYEVNSRIKCK